MTQHAEWLFTYSIKSLTISLHKHTTKAFNLAVRRHMLLYIYIRGGEVIPNTRFTELLTDIEPSRTTKSDSSDAHTKIRRSLEHDQFFSEYWVSSFLAGSYARDTAIRPKRAGDEYERADVDIIVVTNFNEDDDPTWVLNLLAKSVRNQGYVVERVNRRSIRVVTSKAEIDLVPVFKTWDAYKIADREIDGWTATNPPEHTNWSGARNTEFSDRFKPMVKLFKWWRRENRSGLRPKGFVLEVLVAKHAPRGELHYGEGFAQMLESIVASYGDMADRDQKPWLEDPGMPGNNILSKVSITNWRSFISRVRSHATIARRAQNEDGLEEATRLWRKLFGPRFKMTVQSAGASSMSSFAAAPAGTKAYEFPDQAVKTTIPRTFA